ncbi:MAG: ATP-binding protein [bacterium]
MSSWFLDGSRDPATALASTYDPGLVAASWLRFVASDTGLGISEEQIKELFQDFSQADATTSQKYGGTRLGLVISRRFCRMMGGDITVESRAGAGATLTIRLPRHCKPPWSRGTGSPSGPP